MGEVEDGLGVRVLLMALVSLLARRSILLGLKVPPQLLRVDDTVPQRVLLGVEVLRKVDPGFDLNWQQSHIFQRLRASGDLRMYSTNRYTPRKAVASVNTHSAG